MKKYTNHTGGAKGSDTAWEVEGLKYDVSTISYSFEGHRSLSPNRRILNEQELMEGWEMALIAAEGMKRWIPKSIYIRKLLSRDWFQVKNSDAIFAIGFIIKPNEKNSKGYINKSGQDVVDGGTGYAVFLGIKENKPVFVFDQVKNDWFIWVNDEFIKIDKIPILTENFAGIGTRELNENGMNAIKGVYKNTFRNDTKK